MTCDLTLLLHANNYNTHATPLEQENMVFHSFKRNGPYTISNSDYMVIILEDNVANLENKCPFA